MFLYVSNTATCERSFYLVERLRIATGGIREHRRLRHPRRHTIDSHPMLRPFTRQILSELHLWSFGNSINSATKGLRREKKKIKKVKH